VRKVLLALKDQLVHKVLKAYREHKVIKVCKARKVDKVLLALQHIQFQTLVDHLPGLI
jgi:hypothetical protein